MFTVVSTKANKCTAQILLNVISAFKIYFYTTVKLLLCSMKQVVFFLISIIEPWRFFLYIVEISK